jgi:MSHA biogenesis protein MshI
LCRRRCGCPKCPGSGWLPGVCPLFSLFKRKTSQSGLTAIGVHADGFSLATVERGEGERPRLRACAFLPYDTDDRDRQLARLASQRHLKRERCTTLLDEPDYQLLLTEAPDVKSDELKAAIRWRIKDLISFHINDATLDVFDVPVAGNTGRPREMYVVAVQNQAVQRRVDMMNGAGVNLRIIDIPEMAQRNVAALLPEDERGVALLAFHAHGGLITLTRGGELFLSRPLNVGLEMLQRPDNQTGYFDQVVLEVQRSLDYFESHFREAPIRNVALAPLPYDIPGFADYLGANLNTQIIAVDLARLMDCDSELPPSLQAGCFTAIGAALRQEMKVL